MLAGISLGKKAAAIAKHPDPAAKGLTVNFMNKDAFYLVTEEGGQPPAPVKECEAAAAKTLPLSMRLGTFAAPAAGAAPPAPSPARKKAPAKKSYVRPMDAHTRKMAPMFLGQKSSLAPMFLGRQHQDVKPAPKAAPKVETGIIWNSAEGKAYVRHKNGLMTPHEL